MSEKILIIAPAGATRVAVEAFFGDRCRSLISAKRESVIAEQSLFIDDARVLIDGENVADADVAIILDSGYMWPLPTLEPTAAQWTKQRQRFDDYLRDERETNSLWYSFLDIVNACVPICINTQRGFAFENMKPDAFELLRAAGVAVAPTITTNSPEALAAFMETHDGDLLELSLSHGPTRWLDREKVADLSLHEAPVMVQAFCGRESKRIMAIGGEALSSPGPAEVPPAQIAAAQQALDIEWADLVFRRSATGWVLSDFTASPSVDDVDEAVTEQALETLWALTQRRKGGRSW